MRAVIEELKGPYARLLSEHGDHINLPVGGFYSNPRVGDVVRLRVDLDQEATAQHRGMMGQPEKGQ